MGLFSESTRQEKAIKAIRAKINSGEFETARKIIENSSFDLDEKKVQVTDELANAENKSKFERSFEGYNGKQAREALTALRGKVPSYEYDSLESRLKTIEDTDIIAHLNSILFESTREDKIRKFLEATSEGKERKKVIEYVLAKRFVAIEDKFNNAKQEFGALFTDLLNLNSLLERYQNDGASLGDVVDIAKFTAMITEYLSGDLVKATKLYDEKIPGKKVKFNGESFGAAMSFPDAYRTQRSNKLPVGTIGTIFWIDTQNRIWVNFEGEVTENWQNLMNSSNEIKEYYSKYPNHKVAYFKRKELIIVELYNEIEKNTVRKELTRMNELFAQLYSKQEQVVNEEPEQATEQPNINELVSQDFPHKTK
ncbi:hypothetical protein HZA97_08270 [Candidatus Woesearchaeota archaeon]|nr:hypothetical protein [Candidatus Woesearchaeota archaeon]